MRRTLTAVFLMLAWSSAPGQYIGVRGRHLFLDCQGDARGVTVILLSGAGSTTETWSKVQQPISLLARVCSYDRLGVGRSDPLPAGQQQSVHGIVSDLSHLLKAAKIKPPYILVGHSIGGLYARAYDKQHHSEVAGMVLIDSSHEEQIWRFAQSEPGALSEYPRWRDRKFMLSQGFLPPLQHVQWKFSKPLIVLEHGIPSDPVWHEMQLDLASRSPEGRLVKATESSHYIQKLQPDLVIAAVGEVLTRSEGHRAR